MRFWAPFVLLSLFLDSVWRRKFRFGGYPISCVCLSVTVYLSELDECPIRVLAAEGRHSLLGAVQRCLILVMMTS